MFYSFSFIGTGVCYRTLGRADEAKEQFQVALALSPDLLSAQYNLGLVYQEKNDWESAVEIYRNVTKHLAAFPNAISADKAAECKVRECDLLLAMYRFQESLQCWKDGTVLFPRIATFHHELGDLQGRVSFSSRGKIYSFCWCANHYFPVVGPVRTRSGKFQGCGVSRSISLVS